MMAWLPKAPLPMPQAQALQKVFVAHIEGGLNRLYGVALRLTRNPSDAEELVAETVARAWACLETLHDPERCVPWMIRIMTNLYISERRTVRSRTVHEEYMEEPDPDGDGFSLFDRLHQPFLLWWGNPEQAFLDQMDRRDIAAALDQLPESFRVVVMLSDVEGLTYQEIADSLNVPVGTVRSRLARARGQLQKTLWTLALEKGYVQNQSDS